MSFGKAKNSFLITGTSSGLGKYLHDNLGGDSLTRQTSEGDKKKIKAAGIDVIIHCAFNSENKPKNLDQYFQDNVLLTEELTKILHKKFIYISSVDVYPKDLKRHKEDQVLDVNKTNTLYARTKLLSENVIKKSCPNFLILRCTALLGKDSRKNSLIKILQDDRLLLSLSEKSAFNYILHYDALDFINFAIEKDLQGIYNLASSKNITLKEVATLFKKKVIFGDCIYNVGNINNQKIVSIFPTFKKTSEETILKFINYK